MCRTGELPNAKRDTRPTVLNGRLNNMHVIFEPRSEKTGSFRPGPTQTGLYSHRRWLEA